jgi:multidrug resistance efflux pump
MEEDGVQGPSSTGASNGRNGSGAGRDHAVAVQNNGAYAPEAPEGDTRPGTDQPPGPSNRKKVIAIGSVIILLIILAAGGWYLKYTSQFVSTDNAQVDGNQVDINAPATGTVVNWDINLGSRVHNNQVVGRIKILGSFAQPQQPIKAPGDGTIAVNNVVAGQYVTAGTQLAIAYDFNDIYITARVDETDIKDVHPGAQADIEADAFPDAHITGVVEEIQGGAAAVFSQFPQDNSTGNFQKVTQVIPVRIRFTGTDGAAVVPGENVTVKIHKQVVHANQ